MARLKHARLTLPKIDVGGRHPFRNKANHDRLLEYIQDRLATDKDSRSTRVERFGQIDRDVAGWILRKDESEVQRENAKINEGKPVALETHLPLTFIHMDDMMTYYAQTFAPNRGMFYQLAAPAQSEIAANLASLFNYHAVYSGFYRQVLKGLWSILKYNYGGVELSWDTEFGPKVVDMPDGTTQVEQVKTFGGNAIKALDMYNLFWDSTVDPIELHKKGEWAARVELKSHYAMKALCMKGIFHNCADILEAAESDYANVNHTTQTYYVDPPTEARLNANRPTSKGSDWMSILGAGQVLNEGQYEVVTMFIRINPNDFGLIPGTAQQRAARNQYEIWRIEMLDDRRIIGATHLNNVHQHIPIYFGLSNDDTSGEDSKSPAETIQPLTDFASFLMNTHVKATRKNIYGTTYYDPSRIDLSVIPAGEVAANIPVKPQGYGKPVGDAVHKMNQTLDTQQTLGNMQGVMDIINQIFPTQAAPSQIAGIDRAISSQVAAVQQGVNRRQHKGARLIDDTLMRPLRTGMYYNVVQYQEDGEEIPDFYGAPTKVDLSQLRDTNLSTVIGMGLMAIDRQATMDLVQKIIFTLIQNPQAAQGIDLLGMMDYWVKLMDVEMNLSQFQKSPEQIAQETAAADPQAAAAQGVTPMNNPMNSGTPIYGGDPGM